ncbi:biotin/lipoyl-binding protein [Sporomusa acidovorans]|uniref:Lipoyl-binding domain-containing protein n=1 Tax=Sporomusa acidovorans (strain ATCC 49682 / DSM 3132 / Mol) TaxID=1123286 RepID=A0ABZ3J7Z9_SPOA4|nr:biotin/lipoyl-binding protein [Sporomusa acidovorans]OZC19274.1 biotin-requiring enzyme [Sporomusa acidovorans DSM 3132]SDD82235.1 Biotin-lipoyl like [Sporomusa acidovorans]
MAHKKGIIAITLLLTIGLMTWVLAAGQAVEQRGVLSGSVLANGLVAPGATAREGDILVYVQTIAGPAAAVRANVDGVVRDVLVRPGDKVKTGDVLVKIEPFKK